MRNLPLATISLTIGISAGALVLRALAPDSFVEICREDHLVESSEFVFWLLGAVTFASTAHATRESRLQRFWMILLALLGFWVAGEEVSWGQRVFGLATPAWLASRNVQRELNLHNLDGVHQHIRAIGLVLLAVLAFAIPLVYRRARAARALVDRLGMPVFPLFASPAVALGATFMAVPRLSGRIVFELDEIGELLIPLAFAAFALSCAPAGAATIAAAPAPAEKPLLE